MAASTATGPASVVCCDLDGVIWRGDEPVPGSSEAVSALHAAGLQVGFLSNNSNATTGQLVAKLTAMGIRARPDEVLTSARATAALLAGALPRGAAVLVCAGPGVVEALEAVGLTPVRTAPADAVVVGWHRDFDYDELDRAASALRSGARFVATNADPTYPSPNGLIPGAGAIAAAIATASGRAPEVAGKPYPPTVEMVRQSFGSRGLVVGDRPSTDGALADALGWPFALVLSGVTAAEAPPGGEPIPDPPPPFVGADLRSLAPRLIASLAAS